VLTLGTESYRRVVIDDNFETGIDPLYWGYDLGDGSDRGIPGWGNGELQWYTEENASVADGKLIIEAQKEFMGGKAYTSARLTSYGRLSFDTGLIEIEAKLPSGQGIWPAIWMLGDNLFDVGWPNSGEIDIVELRGSSPEDLISTAHWSDLGGNWQYRTHTETLTSPLSDGFHVYGLEKTDTQLTWLLDGSPVYTQSIPSYPGGDEFLGSFHLLINVAVGGHFDGAPSAETSFPKRLEVERVTVLGEESERNILQSERSDATEYGTSSDDRIIINHSRLLVEAGTGDDHLTLRPDGVWGPDVYARNVTFSGIQIGQEVPLIGTNRFSATVNGDEGHDTIRLTEDGDAFFLHDSISGYGSRIGSVVDHAGRETLSRAQNIESIEGGPGDDLIDLTSPTLSMQGDTISVYGGDGDDILWGNDGNDILQGDDGDDTIVPGPGFNTLAGGFGADTFSFTASVSVNLIRDLQPDQGDQLVLLLRQGLDSLSDVSMVSGSVGQTRESFSFDPGTVLTSGNHAVALVTADVPSDTTGTAVSILKPDVSGRLEEWAYTAIRTLEDGSEFISGSDKTITLDVWSPEQGTSVLLKLENKWDYTRAVELSQATSTVNQWETLAWDFTGLGSATETYDKAVIFINGGQNGNDSYTYYLDNLTYQTQKDRTVGEVVLEEIGDQIQMTATQRSEVQLLDDLGIRYGDSYILLNEIQPADFSLDVSYLTTEII
jgi:beta-glucanase (GH16 family)